VTITHDDILGLLLRIL